VSDPESKSIGTKPAIELGVLADVDAYVAGIREARVAITIHPANRTIIRSGNNKPLARQEWFRKKAPLELLFDFPFLLERTIVFPWGIILAPFTLSQPEPVVIKITGDSIAESDETPLDWNCNEIRLYHSILQEE
jgi:hypothetical protein